MLNGILWILRTGAPWRDLPLFYGPWESVYSRFRRWSIAEVWDELLAHIFKNNDNECNMIDSTAVKAKDGQFFQALGRSSPR